MVSNCSLGGVQVHSMLSPLVGDFSVTFMSADSWDMHQLRQPLDHILVRCPIFSPWMMFTAVVKRGAYRTAATWIMQWKIVNHMKEQESFATMGHLSCMLSCKAALITLAMFLLST